MAATWINAALVLLGSALGLLFGGRVSGRVAAGISSALGLSVLGIGISSMIRTENALCLIVCMVLGTLLGELLRIEERMDGLGQKLSALTAGKGGSRFAEGFVNATVIFCVGAMAINGALEAGMNHRCDILISKSVLDGVTSVTLAASMGAGVAFSAIPILLYQGGMTLLFAAIGQGIPPATITEMSAVGGAIIFAIGLNTLRAVPSRLRVGNMLPAIFLPLLYLPLADRLAAMLPGA